MFSRKFLLIIEVIGIVILTGCSGSFPTATPSPSQIATEMPSLTSVSIQPTAESPSTKEQMGLPNPASVYCEEQGGVLEIRTDNSGGQYGICKFANGTECEEWAFFRGDCQSDRPTTITPASEPDKVIYTNEAYGFHISYLDSWAIQEHPDFLLFIKPGYQLFLGYQKADEEPKPFRTGMPEGEFIYGGNATLLGQSIPKNILVFEGRNKVVAYSGRIKAGNLIIVMYLDGLETPDVRYQDIHIPPEIIAEADEMIASFSLISGEQPRLEFNP